jgi:DNA modification methylase
MKIEVSKLKSHPLNDRIYSGNMDIDDLVENIQKVGLLEPLVVIPGNISGNYLVLSGNRRLKCLKHLEISHANVRVINVEKSEIPLMIVSYNRTRVKKPSCILKEILILEKSYRIGRGSREFQKRFVNVGKKVKGDTREIVGEKIGISTGQVSKLKYIYNIKPELFDRIDDGELTINQAYIICERLKNQEDAKKVNKIKGRKNLHSQQVTILNKSSEVMDEIPNNFISAIITSPVFYLKRRYSNNENELGNEKSSEDYIKRLCNHMDECYRVMSKDGVMFLHLDDTYDENGSLQNIPHRVIIEMIKRRKWILRNTIINKKSNPLPSSVKNRLSSSYDFIFMLVKSRNYSFNHIRVKSTSSNKSITPPFHRGNNTGVSPYISDGKKNIQDFLDEVNLDIIVSSVANQIRTKKRFGLLHPCPFPEKLRKVLLGLVLPPNNSDKITGKKRSDFRLLDPFCGLSELLLEGYENGISVYGYDVNSNFTKSVIKEFRKLGASL